MGRGKAVSINGQFFATSAEFKAHIQKLLADIPQGVVIEEPHHSFLCQLIRRHKEAADKIGTGIKYFKVLTNTNYGGKNRCFYLFRKDGTQTDFSYQKCVSTPTHWEEYLDALRSTVMDHLVAEREKAFGAAEEILCPVRKVMMTRSVSYIDHTEPDTFLALADRFNDEEWIHEANPPVTEGNDLTCGRQLEDKGLEERWRYFHKMNAKLRVISKEAHREVTVA
jgi:Protein of unknown function (DUF3223).